MDTTTTNKTEDQRRAELRELARRYAARCLAREEKAQDSRARRAAQRAGLTARKSRWRKHSYENEGAFMLLDPSTNCPVAGFRYDLSAAEVVEYCALQDLRTDRSKHHE